MLRFEYARSALGLGLRLRARFDLNPLRFGMIGSTDSHTALSTTDEDNFWGKAAPWEPGVSDRINKPFLDYRADPEDRVMSWQQLAAGYAAVWASDNTREAIFDAIARREVYATTGTRIAVRLFAGWSFTRDDAFRPDMARIGYGSGVPMGGMLPKAPDARSAPVFLLAAMRDPAGANLDRIQIVKGWIDEHGNTHERVYDLAWSDERRPGADGRLPYVGNTVDIENVSWSNTIGSAELRAAWRDPDFDSRRDAFYYARVLEIATPRWILYDHQRLGTQLPAHAQLTHQERAYTSPIWYEAP